MIPKARKAKGILNRPMPGRSQPNYREGEETAVYSRGDLVELITASPLYVGGSLHISHEFAVCTLVIVLRTDEWSRMIEIIIGTTKIWLWGEDLRIVHKVPIQEESQSDTSAT